MSTTTNKNPDKKCHELLSRLGLEYNVIYKKGRNHTCVIYFVNPACLCPEFKIAAHMAEVSSASSH